MIINQDSNLQIFYPGKIFSLLACAAIVLANPTPGSTDSLNLHLEVDFAVTGNDPSELDSIRLALKEPMPPTTPPRYIHEDSEGGQFKSELEPPGPGKRVIGYLSHKVNDHSSLKSRRARHSRTKFCFLQNLPLPNTAAAFVALQCREGEKCRIKEAGGIVSECISASNAGDFIKVGHRVVSQHNISDMVWIAPSLTTLSELKKFQRTGYTRFQIEFAFPSSIDADAYSYAVKANGNSLYFDGLAPGDEIYPLTTTGPLKLEFGLENLNFAGWNHGCDRLDLELTLYAKGKQIKSYQVIRPYAALRSAPSYQKQMRDGTKVTWNGSYIKAPGESEWEVFALSGRNRYIKANFGETPSPKDRTRIEKLKEAINYDKRRFDRLKLQFEGQRVFGVIRPPLRKWAYGLAVGLEDPDTKQLRFTFSLDEAERLHAWLSEVRLQRKDARKVLINPPNNLYEIIGGQEEVAPAVCEPLLPKGI